MKIINEFILSDNDPMAFMYAFKGGGKGSTSKSQAEKEAEAAQQKELADLQAQEEARTAAMNRRRRGRASLISGEETGQNLSDTLGG